MATIDVSAGELRLRYQTDDAGRLPLGTTIAQSFGAVRPHLQAAPFFLLATSGRAAGAGGTVLAGPLG